MSFLGMAFEMSSIDAGLSSGIDKATSGLNDINSMMEKQLEVVEKLKGAGFSNEMEMQSKSLDRTTKAILNQNVAWSGMSDGATDFASKVDGVLSGWENGFKDTVGKTSEWWDDQWENSFKTFRAWGKKTKGVVSDVSGIYKTTLEPRLDAVKEKMGNLLDGVVRFGKKGGNIIHSFGEGIGNAGRKIGDVIDGMRSRIDSFNLASIASKMKDLTGETGNLSNSMESTFASMAQTTKPIVAQLNVSADRMKKINGQAAGIAYGLNTDAGAVAEMMVSMEVANKGAKEAMDEMGMSTRDWTKVIQTTGVPMSDYTALMGDLTASWNATPKQAAKMIDSLMAIGKQTGTGTLSIKSAKGYLDEIGDLFQTLPPNLARSADEIESLMLSTAKFSGALVKMGETPARAEEMARATGKMFAEQAVMVDKAFEVGGERAASNTPLIRGMMQIGMSFEQARDVVSKGSRDVAAGMQDINAAFQKYGPTASAYGMEQLQFALGEGASGLSYLASNAEIGTAALADVVNMSVEGAGALKKFGKDAFSSGLTLQDTYNRAQEAFDTTIRSIARANVVGLVGKQMAGIREAGKEIKALGGDKTWGPLVNAMSQYQQMGIGGIFAQMAESSGQGAKNAAKFGAKLGLVFKTMGQLGDDLAPLMQLAGMFGPGGMLVGGLGLATIFMMSPKERKDILGSYSSMFDEVSDNLTGALSNIDLEAAWPKVKKFGDSMSKLLRTMWGKMIDAGVIKDVGDGLKLGWDWFVRTVDWKAGFNKFGEGLSSSVDWAVDNLPFDKIGDRMGGMFVKLAPVVWEVLKSAWEKVGKELGPGGQLALGAVIAGKVGGGGVLGALASGSVGLGKGIFNMVSSSFTGDAGATMGGQFGATFGTKLLSFMRLPITDLGASAGASFMSKIGSAAGKAGLVGLALAAGIAIGDQIWKAWQRMNKAEGAAQKKQDLEKLGMVGKWMDKSAGKRSGTFEGLDVGGAASGKDYASLQRIALGIQEGQIKTRTYADKKDRSSDFYGKGTNQSLETILSRDNIWKKMEDRLSNSDSHISMTLKDASLAFRRVEELPEFQDKLNRIIADQKGYAAKLKSGGMSEGDAYEKSMERMSINTRGLAQWAGSKEANNMLRQYESEKAAVSLAEAGLADGSGVFSADEMQMVKDHALKGGWEIGKSLGSGLKSSLMDSNGDGRVEVDEALMSVAKDLGGSLPETGPLANGTVAFDGGYETMLSFADGISSAAEMVRLAVEETMNDAVIYTMEEYATKMKDIVSQKNVLESLAKQMVSNLGGKIETTVDNENDINVKKNFEAALSLPGFAGVILAVSNEGAQTRKMLAKILAENEKQTMALESKSPNGIPVTGKI